MDGALPLNPTLGDRSDTRRAIAVLPALLHRLATPAGTIVNYLYLLEDDPALSPNARDALAPLRRAADAITGTLAEARRLLDASERPIRLSWIDPVPVLERAAHSAGDAGIVVHAETHVLVHACPEALEAALVELLRLLAPYAAATPIPIRIESLETDHVQLTLAVPEAPWTPEACGALPEVFAPVPEGHDDAGAGLAIVATLVRRMHGSMRREADPDAGAQVVLRLPRERERSA